MRRSTSGLSIVLAIGLLAGSAVGVAAQSEDADPMAPAVVTGSIDGRRDLSGSVTTDPGTGATITESVGFRQTWEASDPRLSGSVIYTGNWHSYGDGDLQVEASSVVLDNAEGRWIGTGTAMVAGGLAMDTMILRGEGAYEGLTAYVVQDWAQGPVAAFTAAIFPGEMPVSPDPRAAE